MKDQPGGFQQSGHRVEFVRIDRGADQRCGKFRNVVRALDDLDIADWIVGFFQHIGQQIPHFAHTLRLGENAHVVGRLRRSLVDRGAVDRVHKRPKQGIASQDRESDYDGFREQSNAR